MSNSKNKIMETTEIINNTTWTFREQLENHTRLWTTDWFCDDGDGVELYIENREGGFELNCFSGIPSSHIYIDYADFGVLWNKAFGLTQNENGVTLTTSKQIQDHTYEQQCLMLAEWFCELFCSKL